MRFYWSAHLAHFWTRFLHMHAQNLHPKSILNNLNWLLLQRPKFLLMLRLGILRVACFFPRGWVLSTTVDFIRVGAAAIKLGVWFLSTQLAALDCVTTTDTYLYDLPFFFCAFILVTCSKFLWYWWFCAYKSICFRLHVLRSSGKHTCSNKYIYLQNE